MVTKYRRKILRHGMEQYLLRIIYEIQKYYPGVQIITANTDQDHLHLCLSIPPKWSVYKIVNIIKSNTGRKMRSKFPWLQKVYWGQEGIWSDGYFMSTVGIDEETIKRYIDYQGKEDSGQAQLELL
jgi:putative transposase